MTLMQHNFKSLPIQWLLGDADVVSAMLEGRSSFRPFDSEILEFLNSLSKTLLKDKKAKEYPEVITFAFWIRKASLSEKQKFYQSSIVNRLGRGIVFHIAPSNVPVNFAYSLVSALLAGNANIVKVPSLAFEQVEIILNAIRVALDSHVRMRNSIVCVRYNREKSINDAFTNIANSRLIWGGDATIENIRHSVLPPRSNEITFSDRYSIAVINADDYLEEKNKEKIAIDFFNDTYLSDQNACTSPVMVFWLGKRTEEAKEAFWGHLYAKVRSDYALQAVQSVAKHTKLLEWSAQNSDLSLVSSKDNLITRVKMEHPAAATVSNHGHSGLFLEYDAESMDELFNFCNSTRCQTIGYFGDLQASLHEFIFCKKPKGVDRVVPIGKTMDFDLVWDGVDLILGLSRVIDIH